MTLRTRLTDIVKLRRLAGISLMVCALPASAHVKWFASWDIICPPRDPMRVFSSPAWRHCLVAAVLAMALLAWLDWWLSRQPGTLLQRRDRLHRVVLPYALPGLRIGLCLYWLLAAFGLDHAVYLTPELTAPAWVPWLQLGCALAVLRRATAWLAGVGMIGLYLLAIADHGWFHLLDYPVFAVLGLILLLPRLQGREDAELALQLLRWGAAVTLLWGGVEKFAYPEWSFEMLRGDAVLSLGVAPETAMLFYGFGEIAMAFGLLLFGVGSQVSAALLLVVFVAAVPAFGWVDLVGHSGIIVALVLLSVTRPLRVPLLDTPLRHASVHAAAFPGVVLLLCAGYFGLHALSMPPPPAGAPAGAPANTLATAQGQADPPARAPLQ